MARDIKIEFDTTYMEGDLILGESDLERDEGLSTAVLISLFTDRRADESEPYDNEDRRGWWGDLLAETEGDQIGSKLYLLNRSTNTQQTTVKAKEYIYEALDWMIDDGVAAKIDIDVEVYGLSSNLRLYVLIQIHKKDGNIELMKFDDLWANTPTIGG